MLAASGFDFEHGAAAAVRSGLRRRSVQAPIHVEQFSVWKRAIAVVVESVQDLLRASIQVEIVYVSVIITSSVAWSSSQGGAV